MGRVHIIQTPDAENIHMKHECFQSKQKVHIQSGTAHTRNNFYTRNYVKHHEHSHYYSVRTHSGISCITGQINKITHFSTNNQEEHIT
jgi:hypothetical protein